MFFERGSYDPESVAEGRARLSQFQGATAISSNQYFGREEEDTLAEGADGGLLGDGSLAGLESAARDAVTRLMANPDVQNLGDNLRSGALKVCDRSLMRDGNARRTNALAVVSSSSRTIWHRCQNANFAWDWARNLWVGRKGGGGFGRNVCCMSSWPKRSCPRPAVHRESDPQNVYFFYPLSISEARHCCGGSLSCDRVMQQLYECESSEPLSRTLERESSTA